MKNVLEDMGAVRIRAKTKIIKEELDLETNAKIERTKYNAKKFVVNSKLSETKKDWNETQNNRWEVVKTLENFQEIIYSYEIISDLFDIFDKADNADNALSFQDWFSKISKLENIIEMQNSGRMIQNHLSRIMNYFNNGFSNAFAEGLNSRIQRFVSDLRGFKDTNYMLYRIITKFA